MTKVILHGILGKLFGEEWDLEIMSPGEALRAIETNTGKLFSFLREREDIEYRVVIDGQDCSFDELKVAYCAFKRIHFIPVIKGSDNGGIWQIIAGIALILIAIVVTVAQPEFAPVTGEAISFGAALLSGGTGILVTLGVSMLVGGVAQMLTPSPKTEGTDEKPNNQPSYLFQGAVNTTRQGNPVPVGYGRLRVGSQVISAGFRAIDIPV
jgi:predicted phage tail protein